MASLETANSRVLTLEINGRLIHSSLPEATPLLALLRQDLALTGSRIGCSEGHCGACTVHMDGRPTQSCNLPLWSAEGRKITTIEAFLQDPLIAMVRDIFLQEQAAQCGYCSNGIIMRVAGCLRQNRTASYEEIIAVLDARHLCRCGAQSRILSALKRCLIAIGSLPTGAQND